MAKVTFDNRNNLFYQSLKISVEEYFETNKIKKTGDWRLYIKTVILIGSAVAIYCSLMFLHLTALPALLLSALLGMKNNFILDALRRYSLKAQISSF